VPVDPAALVLVSSPTLADAPDDPPPLVEPPSLPLESSMPSGS
jgi:hypothetical protein